MLQERDVTEDRQRTRGWWVCREERRTGRKLGGHEQSKRCGNDHPYARRGLPFGPVRRPYWRRIFRWVAVPPPLIPSGHHRAACHTFTTIACLISGSVSSNCAISTNIHSYLAIAFFASEEVGSLLSPDLQFHVVTAKITRPCAFVSAKRPWPYRRRSTRETLSLLCSTNSERNSTTTMIGESGSSRSVHVQETIPSAGQRHLGRLRTSLRS